MFKKKMHLMHLIAMAHDPARNKKISNALKSRKHTWQDKINKNPAKIAKTAAKHRGMKRSDKTCKSISAAKKNFYKTNVVYNKDLVFIYNEKTNERKYIAKNEALPDGWKFGLGPTKAKGKRWYMNPEDFT